MSEDKELKDAEKAEKKKKIKPPKAAELLEKIADLESKILYLQADYQNYRKRTAKDINDARVSGTANALEPFLRVNDFLGMAQIAVEKSDISAIGTSPITSCILFSMGFIPIIRPLRLLISPITSPSISSGTQTLSVPIGSRRTGLACDTPSRNAIPAAVLNAISEESTG